MRSLRRALLPALVAGLGLGATLRPAPVASAAPDRPDPKAVPGHGLLRGTRILTDPLFRWLPKEEARFGVLGVLEGTTKEFESVAVELGADRTVMTAAQRAAYEAYRFTHVVARGELATVEPKADGCVVRLKLRDQVYAAATRQLGRTVVFARGECTKKEEPGLVKLLKAAVGWVSTEPDDVDGWLPKEIKATWTRVPSADLLVLDDGTLEPAVRDAALKVVRDTHAHVRRWVAASNVGSTPPVVRVTKNRDMLGFLSGRRELRTLDAAYVAGAAELVLAPRRAEVETAQVADEAAAQMLHHLLGSALGEPVATGMRRAAAAAVARGAGALLAGDEAAGLERVKGRTAVTWSGLLRMSGLGRFLAEDAEVRSLDAELAVVYLTSPQAAASKASFAAWVAQMRKVGDPDAASEAAFAALDAGKSDAEYWAFWTAKADPPKKPAGKGR